jgi:uncharacterized membrane protein YkoI
MEMPKLLDTIALADDMTVKQFGENKKILLRRGQVGVIVEVYNNGAAYEVEFSDDDGETVAMLALKPEQLILLHHKFIEAEHE